MDTMEGLKQVTMISENFPSQLVAAAFLKPMNG
jgi:hypothetical protein